MLNVLPTIASVMAETEEENRPAGSSKKVFEVDEVRKDFPILERVVNGRSLVYLDSAATSQKPKQVIDSIVDYYSRYNSNIHRGIHSLGEEATSAYEGVREKAADFIKAPSAREIIFTRNTTEAVNLVASTYGRILAGDEILLTPLEHHSNLIPWQTLAKERDAKLVFCDVTEDGRVDLESVKQLINERTRLVAVTLTSNVLGTIVPVAEIAAIAKARGAVVFVDGAQAVPHVPVSVQELGCDFLAFSMHKMLGPTGVGILWGKMELLEQMPPQMYGGNMINSVWRDRVILNQVPWKFEAGTPNIADVIASGVAFDYLTHLGMDNVRAHEKQLCHYAMKRFTEIPGITLYGPRSSEDRAGVFSFNLDGVHPHDVGQIVNEEGIAIRVGHHCCQPLMRDLDIAGTARASFYIYTTEHEIDLLVGALEKARKVLGHVACR